MIREKEEGTNKEEEGRIRKKMKQTNKAEGSARMIYVHEQ